MYRLKIHSILYLYRIGGSSTGFHFIRRSRTNWRSRRGEQTNTFLLEAFAIIRSKVVIYGHRNITPPSARRITGTNAWWIDSVAVERNGMVERKKGTIEMKKLREATRGDSISHAPNARIPQPRHSLSSSSPIYSVVVRYFISVYLAKCITAFLVGFLDLLVLLRVRFLFATQINF